MALTAEDLAQLGAYVKGEVDKGVAEALANSGVAAPGPVTNDEPQNQPENQPDYYVMLSNGKSYETKDSQSTHMVDPETGEACVVVARYPKGV
jgi:hypothetical protein